MPLHRVIGGVQIFLVLIAAIGLDALWRELSAAPASMPSRQRPRCSLLYPMVQERARNLANDARLGQGRTWRPTRPNGNRWMPPSPLVKRPWRARLLGPGRLLGRPASRSATSRSMPSPARANVPAVAFLYHSMALTADIMVRFNEWNPSHYRLFNIRTVVAPAGADPVVPPFLSPLAQNGRFRIFAAPGNSYFDLVDVVASVKTTRNNFYDVNDRWLQSDWVMKRAHLRLDWRDDASPRIARLAPEDALPQLPVLPSAGEVRGEQRNGEVYQAELEALRPCVALFKMTWHANWKAYVDGRPQPTWMLTPGFVGVPLTPGRHTLVMRYQPESWKAALGFAGFAGVLLLLALERRGWLARAEVWTPRVDPPWPLPHAARRRLLIAAGLDSAVPARLPPAFHRQRPLGTRCLRLLSAPRGGSPEHHPRSSLAALGSRPRPWNRPAALPFHPPVIYYLGELWHLLGFDFVTAMNLACAAIVLLSAAAMFLLARLYFGPRGRLAGRRGLPLCAVLRRGPLRPLVPWKSLPPFRSSPSRFTGSARMPGIAAPGHWLSAARPPMPASSSATFRPALLFTPLLIGFLFLTSWMEKSWRVLCTQACGVLLGARVECFYLGAGAGLAAVRRHGSSGTGKRPVHQPLCLSAPVVLFALGLRPFRPRPGRWDVLRARLEPPASGHRGLGLGSAQTPEMGDRRILRFFAAAAVLLCILMLQDALWFWQQVPLLQNVQLPWRLLGPVSICLALVVAQLGRLLSQAPRWRTAGMTAAMAPLIVPNLSHLHSKQLVDVDLTFWTPQQLSLRGFETTSMAEVAPRWMAGLPAYTPVAATVLSGDAEIRPPRPHPIYLDESRQRQIRRPPSK